MTQRQGTLYFHAQCFDGVASAVISRAYLVEQLGWPDPDLVALNYGVQNGWLQRPFSRWTAVVDFLFHPEARFWADHHETAFLAARPTEMQPGWFYDSKADSCAGLLARKLPVLGFDTQRFAELTTWAERTDAARYRSPEEAMFPRVPALVINASLIDASADDCIELVNFLGKGSLADAAQLRSVLKRASTLEERVCAGLQLVKQALRVDQGVATFIVDEPVGTVVHRYAPYAFARDVRYSAGLIRKPDRIRLSVMRNPWLEFESLHLGRLCAKFGGGGHQRVGAATFAPTELDRATRALREIVRATHADARPIDASLINDRPV